MTILYKLTTPDGKTRAGYEPNPMTGRGGETLWGEGVEHGAPGGELCTDKVLHAYVSPEVAVLMNPIHADISDPVLWECDGDVCVRDKSDLKVGCTRLRTIRRIVAPQPTLVQRVRFAILCAKQVVPATCCPGWHEWADKYLAGECQDGLAAEAAEEAAAEEEAWEAARSAAYAASWVARSASCEAAREAAGVAEATTEATKEAAWAAASAAAVAAARTAPGLDLVALAHEALSRPLRADGAHKRRDDHGEHLKVGRMWRGGRDGQAGRAERDGSPQGDEAWYGKLAQGTLV